MAILYVSDVFIKGGNMSFHFRPTSEISVLQRFWTERVNV